jgi:hypothetical protein
MWVLLCFLFSPPSALAIYTNYYTVSILAVRRENAIFLLFRSLFLDFLARICCTGPTYGSRGCLSGARGHSHPFFYSLCVTRRRLLREGTKGEWVFSELKNEPVLSHFYCITSRLLTHCLFGRFFLAFFPLYSEGCHQNYQRRNCQRK